MVSLDTSHHLGGTKDNRRRQWASMATEEAHYTCPHGTAGTETRASARIERCSGTQTMGHRGHGKVSHGNVEQAWRDNEDRCAGVQR